MRLRFRPAAAAALFASAGAAHAQSFTQTFDDLSTLPGSGWAVVNNSQPLGTGSWFQGNPNYFTAQAGTGYAAANINSTSGAGTISNWMISPARTLANGDTLQFWTRTVASPQFPDRLQVRMSTSGSSANVGNTATSVGDFGTLLLDINPAYTTGGYPSTWQQYTLTVSGLPGPTQGRFAFRYFVEDGGPSGTHSTYIGLDDAVYTAGGVPTGACCAPDGTCSMTTSVGCASLQGTFNGLGVNCSAVTCPAPGACCFVSGVCTMTNLTICTNQGGVFQGGGLSCATANCPQPGACCRPDTSCFLGNATQCAAINGIYRGDGTSCATANCPSPGACCKNDGTCAQMLGPACTAIGGLYQGDNTLCVNVNCPQPPTGACCVDSACMILNAGQCANQNGTYRGDNTVCAGANCPPNLVANGGFEAGSFAGWTQFGNTTQTGLTTGPVHGGILAAFFGPPANGGIRQTITAAAGTPLVVEFWYQAQGAVNFFSASFGGPVLVSFTNDTGHTNWTRLSFNVTPASANPVLEFTFMNSTARDYLDGVRVYPNVPVCYPNCDGSTTSPVLNIADFTCFLNKFASGDMYANCDGSTIAPVLNIADFSCFLNRFSVGCS